MGTLMTLPVVFVAVMIASTLATSSEASTLSGIWYGSVLRAGAVQRITINASASTVDLPAIMAFDEPAQIESEGARVTIDGDGFHIDATIQDGVLIGDLSFGDEKIGPIQATPNPRRVIRGREMPDFDLNLLDTDQRVSNESLSGKYYIVDFWATWCGRCTGEIPNMMTAYEKYGDDITFLSVSVDDDQDMLKEFLGDNADMTWLQANISSDSELVKKFEIAIRGGGLPLPVLVSPEGTILAAGFEELQGFRLDYMLNRFIGSEKTN